MASLLVKAVKVSQASKNISKRGPSTMVIGYQPQFGRQRLRHVQQNRSGQFLVTGLLVGQRQIVLTKSIA